MEWVDTPMAPTCPPARPAQRMQNCRCGLRLLTMTKTALRAQARQLREQGRSVPEIATALSVARSTAWMWVRDLPAPPRGDLTARRHREWLRSQRRDSRRRRYRALFEAYQSVGDLTARELLLVGAVAYWAEGAKSKPWCQRDRLNFVNSDPDMIRLFLRWLEPMLVDRADVRVSLQIHQSADVGAAERFWSDVVGIPVARFNKTSLKRHNPTTRRRNTGETYRGCLRVDVHRSAETNRRMEGSGTASWRAC
jgi:hypothetical protein